MQQLFELINPDKYKGPNPIFLMDHKTRTYQKPAMGALLRSSWEAHFARNYCDLNEACLEWNIEPCEIPYFDPTSGRHTVYIPDFIFSYLTPSNQIRTALIEIKPIRQTVFEYAKKKTDDAIIIKNMAKWQAAQLWCEQRDVLFQVLTEADLFGNGEHIPKSKRKAK